MRTLQVENPVLFPVLILGGSTAYPEGECDSEARAIYADHARFFAGVNRGIEQADRGELVDHEEVRNRIERLLRS